jgi:4-hydroxy-tetrahydrodipicolinate reductase
MIRTIVSGANGKMGRRICALTEQDSNLELVGAIEYSESPEIGNDIGVVCGIGKKNIQIISDLESIIGKGEVIIEFSTPDATLSHLRIAAENKKAMVIGTTGLNEDDIEQIKKMSARIPIVFTPNMSLGVNILFKLVEDVAKLLGEDYDIEIVEMHHRFKKDAPSGTALKLAEHAAAGLGENLSDVAVYGREGAIGERQKNQIGVMSLRGGDVVGDHTVIFAGLGERLELTHKATSRDTFALGALRAAGWVIDKVPGLYNMQDVLGIK